MFLYRKRVNFYFNYIYKWNIENFFNLFISFYWIIVEEIFFVKFYWILKWGIEDVICDVRMDYKGVKECDVRVYIVV